VKSLASHNPNADHFSSETHTQKPVRFSLALCINSPLTERPFPRDQKSFAGQIETWYKWFPKGEETGICRKDFVMQMVSTNAGRWSLAGQKSGANGDRRLIRYGHLRNRSHASFDFKLHSETCSSFYSKIYFRPELICWVLRVILSEVPLYNNTLRVPL